MGPDSQRKDTRLVGVLNRGALVVIRIIETRKYWVDVTKELSNLIGSRILFSLGWQSF